MVVALDRMPGMRHHRFVLPAGISPACLPISRSLIVSAPYGILAQVMTQRLAASDCWIARLKVWVGVCA